MNDDSYIKIIKPIPIDRPKIIKINESDYIVAQLYKQKGNVFYDIVLKNNDEDHFIGRYNIIDNLIVDLKCKNKKILVSYIQFSTITKKTEIVKVETLYDLEDDCFYNCTEEEALLLFDKDLNSSHLKNKSHRILRSDSEKKKKLNLYKDYNFNNSTMKEEQKTKIIKFPK